MSTHEPAPSAESEELEAEELEAEGFNAAAELEDEPTSPGDEELDPFLELARERDEYLDSLRRLQAEFDNYRKRVTRQQGELLERASESLLERLLPTLDALDMARLHSGDPTDQVGEQLAAALGQISSLLRDTLAKEGLERIDEVEVGFDPTVHDAVARDPGEGEEPHGVVVAEVLRPGYRLKGRVVRPAMVRVRG